MSKAKRPKKINLHKSFKGKERPTYGSPEVSFNALRHTLTKSSFEKWNRIKIYPRITRPQAFKDNRDLYFCK